MKNIKKSLALLSAVIMAMSAASCGKDAPSETSEDVHGIVSDTETSEKDSKASAESSEDADDISVSDKDSSSKSDSSSKKDASSLSAESKADNSKKDGASSASGNKTSDSGKTNASGGTSSGESASSGSSSGSASSGGSSSGGTSGGTSSGGTQSGSTSGGTSSDNGSSGESTAGPEQSETAYTAEISLGSSTSFTGSNVSVSGEVVTITAGGDYHVKGTLNGQLHINTTEKVKVVLSGVNITSESGPAIFVEDAKRAVIELEDGTVSTLKDTNKDKVNDGVIFSNDTLRIKGSGTLNITAGNAHGIASDDDIIIEDGIYNITSIKSGMFAHDNITINGGELRINGGTNGIKSKGGIDINGGYSVITGGTKEEKSSIYSEGAFNYVGGTVFAAGNQVTAPTTSATPYIIAGTQNAVSGGSSVSLVVDGTEIVSFVPPNQFRCVIALSPDIADGSSFSADFGSKSYGGFTVSGMQNIFTLE